MYNDNRSRGTGFVPVKVDQELDIKIEAVGAKGDGIAKVQGFVLFVPGGKEGQECRIRVTKVLRNVGFAEIIGDSQGGSSDQASEEAPAQEEEEPKDSEDFGEDDSETSDGGDDSQDDSDAEESSDEENA